MKPEVLLLAHRIPYPPDKGDKIRSWRILSHLTSRFRVHLAAFVDDPRDFAHQQFLESLCESVTLVPLHPATARVKSLSGLLTGNPLSFHYYHDKRMKAAIDDARERPLAAEIAFSSTMAPYIGDARPCCKRIVDFCDADSEKWKQYAAESAFPLNWVYRREARTLARSETDIANWADASFAVTPDEAGVLNERAGLNNEVDWFNNGVDAAFFDPDNVSKEIEPPIDCIFVGAMDYRANVDGVLHFAQSIWPLVRTKKPDARFAIVGAKPAPSIKALHDKNGVIVTGRVDDVRPWLKAASVVVAPLQIARGVQNKVLEAMAMAKPVVATRGAMTGINAPQGSVVVAETDKGFAERVTGLLENEQERNFIGASARDYVVNTLTWEAGLARFDNALTRLGL